MEHLGGQDGPEVSQAEITSLVSSLVESLLSRSEPDQFHPEDIGNGAWILTRVNVPPDVFTEIFESHPDMGEIQQVEIAYVVETKGNDQMIHIDVSAQGESVFRSQHCNKLELWEVFLTSEQDSTVYREYSKDGHVIPMSEHPGDLTDPQVLSQELLQRFRFITQDDMRHLRRLGEWLRE